jgi:histidyl-tRNA synthetase
LQCDIDTVGTDSVLADAEIIAVIAKSFTTLGFSDVRILLNDRNVFDDLLTRGAIAKNHLPAVIRILDKLKKIGREGVVSELKTLELSEENALYVLQSLETKEIPKRLRDVMEMAEMMGVTSNMLQFTPTLARGLDYYTSTIIEIEIGEYTVGSVGGGGRYDNLIGMFSNRSFPAVGFAFGFDRIIEAMEKQDLFPISTEQAKAKVLVTVFSEMYLPQSIGVLTKLQHLSIPSQLYLATNAPMDKQLKYADALNIPFVTIIGPNEAAKSMVTVKNLITRKQKTVTLEALPDEIS